MNAQPQPLNVKLIDAENRVIGYAATEAYPPDVLFWEERAFRFVRGELVRGEAKFTYRESPSRELKHVETVR